MHILSIIPLLFWRAIREFLDDQCTLVAAAVSYYAFFSLFPLILAAISISGYVLGSPARAEDLIRSMAVFLPVSQELLEGTIAGVVRAREEVGAVAMLGLLWSGVGVFAAVRRALNLAWDAPKGRPIAKQKFVEFTMMLGAGMFLLLSIGATAALRILQQLHLDILGFETAAFQFLWGITGALLPAFFTFLIFVLLYRYVPNVPVTIAHVWLGALVATIGFELVKNFFVLYVQGFANYNLVYGSVGAVIALLFWIYLSAIIMLFGAEIAAEYPKLMYRGSPQKGEEGRTRA